MASIYKEGGNWSARVRMEGQSHFKGGFPTQAAAKAWARETELVISRQHKPKGMGTATPLALGLRSYAEDCVVYHKGGDHEVARINPYLGSVGLPLLKCHPVDCEPSDGKIRWFNLTEKSPDEQALPRTFEAYRQQRLAKRPRTAEQRAKLAAMPVGQIATYHIKALLNAMIDDGLKASSINNELSILSAFFTNAMAVWAWPLLNNPVDSIQRPKANNQRDRVLSDEEQTRLVEALKSCANPYVAPYVYLAIETTMRKSEMLLTSRWEDIDWERRVLILRDSKTGPRGVPLTLEAVFWLKSLPNFSQEGQVFEMSADALDSAWERACQRAGISNLRIHDLRHTGATRHAKRLDGNVFLLKLVTGHKSLSMLQRYVNLKEDDVVVAFDATLPPASYAPSQIAVATEPVRLAEPIVQEAGTSKVVDFNAWRRRSA